MDALQSAESINSYFIEQIKDYAIFTIDTNGIICAWNSGAERMKGYTEEEAVGQYYGILHPDEFQQEGRPQQELKEALENKVFTTEDWRKRKDGSLFWASVTLTPIFDAQYKHIGFTKITGDLTKQKELQDKLAQRRQEAFDTKSRELNKTNQDLDSFIYTASHDLRSPITNIEALIAVLKQELMEADSLAGEPEEVLTKIESSVNRLKQTIGDLTEISKLQNNLAQELNEDIINIKEVYDDIMADLNYPSQNNQCFISTDFQIFQLKFSRNNIRSILYNLISNAIKYHSPDRPCIINLQTRLEHDFVVLVVKDNGLGLNERQQEQLYSIFRRFHDHVEGTGIGLFMVKRIIDNAGGHIELESQEGVGSEFRVYFKAAM